MVKKEQRRLRVQQVMQCGWCMESEMCGKETE